MDKRELILDRMFDILNAVPQLLDYSEHSCFRDRGVLEDDKRPAIVLLDGVENVKNSVERRGRVALSPTVMTLLPQIFVVLKLRKTNTNAGVGPELSAFRLAVINAIGTDKQLIDLCGPNGQISLRRVETDMQSGSTLEGQLRLDFAIDYVLDPSEFPAFA